MELTPIQPEERAGDRMNFYIKELQDEVNELKNKIKELGGPLPRPDNIAVHRPPQPAVAPYMDSRKDVKWSYNPDKQMYMHIEDDGETNFYTERQLPSEGRAFFGLDSSGTLDAHETVSPTDTRTDATEAASAGTAPLEPHRDGQGPEGVGDQA